MCSLFFLFLRGFVFIILTLLVFFFFFFSSRRRHTRSDRDWSSDVCSSDLVGINRDGDIHIAHVNNEHEYHHYNNELQSRSALFVVSLQKFVSVHSYPA